MILAFLLHLFGRLLGAVEIGVLYIYLVGEVSLSFPIILASMTSLIHLIFAFVPGALGLVETFYAGLFSFHHLDPASGLAMQIIRRIRALFWVFMGILLASQGLSNAPEKQYD